MIPWLTPSMIASCASGSFTFRSTWPRVAPNDADLEEFWLEIDRCTRIVYLPMYYWSLLVDRLPGRQFAVWGAMTALALSAERFGLDKRAVGILFGSYILFCIYTWFATPLVKGWIKLFPPKI